MNFVQECKERVLAGEALSREAAIRLAQEAPLPELKKAADEIRLRFCGDDFDLCGVLSIQGGRCSENCRFCPQARGAHSEIRSFALLSVEEIVREAQVRDRQGVRHYCLVSNGRKVSDRALEKILEAVRELRRVTGLQVCASLGLLDKHQMQKLKDAGLHRLHNNLETSRGHFPELCTSHTYEEKLQVIHDAHEAGLAVCSGGIIGAGETMEDRIDLAIAERELGTESIPVNLLHAYPGTPMEQMPALSEEEVERTIAVFRFLLPDRHVRLAAGRDRLPDGGNGCFRAGSNAAITGDMLNVKGITVEKDLESIKAMGYHL